MVSTIVEVQAHRLDKHLEIQLQEEAKLQTRIRQQMRLIKLEAQGRDQDPKGSKMQMHPSLCRPLLEVEIN